ncbi:MAG: hypothetical protein LAO21_16080 [Acidobacteriia bacterium]|nr:hypothetical protein [Terriglobia bacterium]
MPTEKENRRNQVLKAFDVALNRQGHPFQYSVLRRAEELFRANKSKWVFEATEFPVEVQQFGTRVDFVLKHFNSSPYYILAECKRANPAFSDWCFAYAPYYRRNRSKRIFVMEHAELGENRKLRSRAAIVDLHDGPKPYQIAVEIKSGKRGDATGQIKGTIEEAATQVCRALNGMLEIFMRNPNCLELRETVDLLPVIFTTAQIWVSDVDLGAADLRTGEIDISQSNLQRAKWIIYQYHASPGLKHTVPPVNKSAGLGQLMEREYVRMIPIVCSEGIDEFLLWSSSFGANPPVDISVSQLKRSSHF